MKHTNQEIGKRGEKNFQTNNGSNIEKKAQLNLMYFYFKKINMHITCLYILNFVFSSTTLFIANEFCYKNVGNS